MAVELTVEDGTNVPMANSYVDVDAIVEYAANRGVTLPIDDEEVAILAIKAVDYLESKADLYQGTRTYEDQELQHPRYGMVVNGFEVPEDSIHKNLKNAQCALVIALFQEVDLMPNVSSSDYVTKEVIGPITTVYADPIVVGTEPKVTAAEALLKPLYKSGAGGMQFSSVRV